MKIIAHKILFSFLGDYVEKNLLASMVTKVNLLLTIFFFLNE